MTVISCLKYKYLEQNVELQIILRCFLLTLDTRQHLNRKGVVNNYKYLENNFSRILTPCYIFSYSEVWGFEDLSILKRFHLNFCKRVLGVHKYTPNSMLLRELDRDKLIGI